MLTKRLVVVLVSAAVLAVLCRSWSLLASLAGGRRSAWSSSSLRAVDEKLAEEERSSKLLLAKLAELRSAAERSQSELTQARRDHATAQQEWAREREALLATAEQQSMQGGGRILNEQELPRGLPGPPGSVLIITYATESAEQLLLNWVLHVRRLPLAALVVALDTAVLAMCGLPLRATCLDASGQPPSATAAKLTTGWSGRDRFVTNTEHAFRVLAVRKVAAVVSVLTALNAQNGSGPSRGLLVSDADVVWTGDPTALLHGRLPGFEDFAHADMLTSSDCLDPKADDEDNGCFNTLIDRNVGIFYLRGGSPQALALMRAWHARVVALAASTNRAIENEQTVFDDLWRGRGTGHRRNMTREGRAIWYRQKLEWCGMPADTKEGRSFGKPSALDGLATNGSRRVYDVCVPFVARRLRLGGLPLSLIANGHTFFVQQLHLSIGIWPLAVHATFTFDERPDCTFSKRERLRLWGLWLVDGDPMAASPLGNEADAERFLVLHDEDAEAGTLPAALPWRPEDPHARGRQHVDFVDAFRQKLAFGVALARTLNRTIVLPRFWCYCDRCALLKHGNPVCEEPATHHDISA